MCMCVWGVMPRDHKTCSLSTPSSSLQPRVVILFRVHPPLLCHDVERLFVRASLQGKPTCLEEEKDEEEEGEEEEEVAYT